MITQATASGLSHLHLSPRFQAGLGVKRSALRQRRKVGITYARYSPMTPIETTAKNATGVPTSLPDSAGRLRMPARTHEPITAATGTPRLPFTLLHSFHPGVTRSRDSAKNVREQLVTHAMPQKNCPIAEIRITTSAQPDDIALWKIASVVPPPSLTAPTSEAANVIASSTNQPISAESATDCQTPFAAEISASRVSSAT